MDRAQRKLDVICVSNADGEIHPLRLRLEDDADGGIRVDIDQILRIDRDRRFGIHYISVWGTSAQSTHNFSHQICYS